MSNILEQNTVKRGDERFFACPDCQKLFAVKKVANAVGRYEIVTAAYATKLYHWTYEVDGMRQQTKSMISEQEARRRYVDPQRVDLAQRRDAA